MAKQYAEVRKTNSINVLLVVALFGIAIFIGLFIFYIKSFRNRKIKIVKTQDFINIEESSYVNLPDISKSKKKVIKKTSKKPAKKTVKKSIKKTSKSRIR